MIPPRLKSLAVGAWRAYQAEHNLLAAPHYLIRFALQRGPAGIRRRIESRRSFARLRSVQKVANTDVTVALLIGGVVGDTIMAARFLRDLVAHCPHLVVDVFSANLPQTRWIFSTNSGIREHLQDNVFQAVASTYEVALFFSDTVALRHRNPTRTVWPESLAAVLNQLAERGVTSAEGRTEQHRRECLLALDLLYQHGQTRATASQFLAGLPYGGDRLALSTDESAYQRSNLAERKFVTVHNGYSMSEVAIGRASTKSYLKFGEVIAQVRASHSDLIFVQIGAATSTPIPNVDINLVGQTTLPQAAALVRRAWCHLDNESGFVSVASCFGTPCCVVYGPTSPDYFSYAGNAAVRPMECGGCWWCHPQWMTQCPRGLTPPVCTGTIPPQAVASALLSLLGRLTETESAV